MYSRDVPFTGTQKVGQKKVAITGTAVQLSTTSVPLLTGIILTAYSSNITPILVGGSTVANTIDGTGNGYVLEGGASIGISTDNLTRIYINGTGDDFVSWCGF